jgi:hypothetical protein
MCRPFGTHLIDLIFPGTSVPGYRLCRPKGLVGHPGLAFPGIFIFIDRRRPSTLWS